MKKGGYNIGEHLELASGHPNDRTLHARATRLGSLIGLVPLLRLAHDTRRAAPLTRMLTRTGEIAETSLWVLFIEGGSRTHRASGFLRGRIGFTARPVKRSV
jgi:hypothetical protein